MSTPILERPSIDEFIIEQGTREPPCESGHKQVRECSGSVAYRVRDCRESFNVCALAVDHPTHGLRVRRVNPKTRCRPCQRPAIECWSFWPI